MMGIRKLRLGMVHLGLLGVILSFNNCGNQFESTGPLSGENVGSSTGANTPVSEDPTGAILDSVLVDGSDFILEWRDPGSPDNYDILIDGVDSNGGHRASGRSHRLAGLDYGRYCFRLESRYVSQEKWPQSNEICATSVKPPDDDDPVKPPVSDFVAAVLNSVEVDGRDFILKWSDVGSPDNYDVVINGVDSNGGHRAETSGFRVSDLAYGEHCFMLESRYVAEAQWPRSNEVCATSVAPPLDPGDDGGNPEPPPEDPGREVAGRFIDPAIGSDSNDGLSPQQPWKSTSRVRGLPRGTDVWIKAGSVLHNQRLMPNWSGTATDPVIIGTYYMDGRVPRERPRGSKTIKRAEINGTWDERDCNPATIASEQKNGTCIAGYAKFPKSGEPRNPDKDRAVPNSYWAGLIQIEGSFMKVRGLRVKGSAGSCIVSDTNDKNKRVNVLDHIWVEDNDLEHCTTQGIILVDAHHVYIRDNEVKWTGTCRAQQQAGGTQCFNTAKLLNWGSGIRCGDALNSYCLIENNYVHDLFGEGISATLGSKKIIRGNRVERVLSSGIYGNSSGELLIENNIVSGYPNDERAFFRFNIGGYDGIAVGVEATWAIDGQGAQFGGSNVVRNNLVSGTRKCFGVVNLQQDSLDANHPPQGAHFLNNTCISEGIGLRMGSVAGLITDTVVENNIFYTTGDPYPCLVPRATSKLRFGPNVWSAPRADVSEVCRNSKDVYSAKLSTTLTPANWKNNTHPSWRDFQLASGDDGVNASTDQRFTQHPLLNSSIWQGLTEDFSSLALSPVVGQSQCGRKFFDRLVPVDFHCAPRGPSSNMGAINSTK